jgi:hypothetical protein
LITLSPGACGHAKRVSKISFVKTNLDTLVIALYVKIECATRFCWAGWRWKTVYRAAVVAAG